MRHVFVWWLLIQILGLAALPLAHRLFRWLPGRGYAFSKALGLLVTSTLLWLGASLGYLTNTAGGIVVALAATAGLSLWFYARRPRDDDQSLVAFLKARWRLILTVELLFAITFGAWAVLRAYAPDKIMSAGGEKWMEIAFLNGILESRTFPPQDPWLSGFAISYYYFGYVMMALLTQLSGVVAEIGFELYNALIFALTVIGAFGVVHSLVAAAAPSAEERQALGYGLLGSLFVAVMGNLEGLLEAFYARGLLREGFWRWIDIPDLISVGRVTGSWYPGHGWWWWRASRVFRDRNLLGDPMPLNPIAEFPFFSFLLGDNHPHVMALPFVFVAIALALNLLRRASSRPDPVIPTGAERSGAISPDSAIPTGAQRSGGISPDSAIPTGAERSGGISPDSVIPTGAERSGGISPDSAIPTEAERSGAISPDSVIPTGAERSGGISPDPVIPTGAERSGGISPDSAIPTGAEHSGGISPDSVIPTGAKRSGGISSRHPPHRGWLRRYANRIDWPLFAAYALLIGALGFLNTWDLPIYLGLTVLAYGAGRWIGTHQPLQRLLGEMLVLGVGLGIAGGVLYLPFYISFSSQAGGVLPHLLSPTRLPQYFVMFGPFLFVAAWFLGAQIVTSADRRRALGALVRSWAVVAAAPLLVLLAVLGLVVVTESGREFLQRLLSDPTIQQLVGAVGPGPALRAVLLARLRDPWLFLTLSVLIALSAVVVLKPWKGRGGSRPATTASDRFAALLFLCGLALTFIPEFAYLRDTFGVRMNTIFKFYYQGWVMIGCASAYAIWWLVARREAPMGRGLRVAFLAGVVLLAAAGLVYPVMASYSRVRGFEPQPTLDGAANVARSHPDDWAAIEWLRANTPGTSVILEAPGMSYNYEGRISAFTGRPAVLGWALHQSQWRGSYVEQGKREPDIKTIYTTHDARQALELLHKWEVDYVIVGPPERRYTEDACQATVPPCNVTEALAKFDTLLNPVFRRGQTTVYRVPKP